MRSRRLIKIISPVLLGAMALSACGGGENEDDDTDTGTKKVVKIGFIAPLSGDLSALGLGMKNSVDLAIKQANARNAVKGYTIELAAEDDTATANVGATVATKLAGDPAVAAVIGTLNSSVAQQVQPILDKASIAMVSPANTNPTLTQGDKPDKVRPYKSYFRVATTDAIQGPFAAQYVFNTVGKKNVVVIHDKKTYGQGLSDAFKAEFTKLGGKVLATETVGEKDTNFAAVISKINRDPKPELVYYGGEYPVASLLSSQMKSAGLNVPLMGGDGIYSGEFIKTGKAAVAGDLSTSVGAPTDQLDTAKQFVTDYAAGGYAEPYEAYGAYSYDAANVIIDALAKALEGKDSVADARTAIIDAIQATSLKGVTGDVAFDEFGDTTTKVLTVYKVTKCPAVDPKTCPNGLNWVPDKVDTFK